MADRLEAIKAMWTSTDDIARCDTDWLISELEQARARIAELEGKIEEISAWTYEGDAIVIRRLCEEALHREIAEAAVKGDIDLAGNKIVLDFDHDLRNATLDRAAEEIADGLLKEATVDDCIRWARDPASLVADAAAAILKLKEPADG
jgi:hypothetical protein